MCLYFAFVFLWVFFKYMFLERELGGRQAKQVKGIKNYKFPSIKYTNHGDVVYRIGNILNNILVILYNDRWQLDLSW